MKIDFIADKVTFEINEDDNFYMIGFSDNGDDPEQYVIVQRAILFDEQDIELGMGSYYFEYSDQSNSGYGICRNVELDRNKVVFKFKENTIDDIEAIEIKFKDEMSSDVWSEFEDIFNKIFNP